MDDFQLPSDDDYDLGHSPGHLATDAPSGINPSQNPEFHHFGMSAAVDTQTAGTATWLREALDSESNNFLSFVVATIQTATNHPADADIHVDEGRTSIGFETLLPPATNSTIVAAQGFMHLLSLGTKGLLQVSQSDAFGPIGMMLL